MFEPGPPRDERTLPRHFRFASCEIDRAAMRVLRGGVELKLEPRAFDLLLLLAANPGRVVEKEEIFERLWEVEFVSDNALTRVVAALRHELGDRAKRPTIIQTVWKRGYRFLPAIEALESGSPKPKVASPLGSPRPDRPRRRALVAALTVTVITAAIGFAWLHRDSVQSTVPPRVLSPVQLTSEPGNYFDPDFAPDGRQLVFASDIAGGLELFVQPISGGAPRQITHCGVCVEPAWSPNGQWIAYTDRQHGGLWLVSATTGETQQLTDFGTQPAWSPDGRSVVFSNPGSPVAGPLGWVALPGSTIWTVEVDNGRTKELTRPIAEAGGQGSPTFSSDGQWVVFATDNLVQSNLWRVPRAGGKPQPLLPEQQGAKQNIGFWRSPVADPRGGGIYLIRGGLDSPRIERLTLGGTPRLDPVLAPAPAGTTGLSISRDGRYLAYAAQETTTGIEEISVLPDGSTVGTPRTLSSPPVRRVSRPVYSPDGAFLLFNRLRLGAAVEAVVLDRQGREVRVIPDLPVWWPQWASAREVVLEPEASSLRVNVATGRQEPFTPAPASREVLSPARGRKLSWSLGLQRVAFTKYVHGSLELFSWKIRAAKPRQLTHFGGQVTFPSFSKDGRWIIFEFTKHPSLTNELWRVAASGGQPERILSGKGTSWPGENPTHGDLVVYAAQRGGIWHLAVAGPHSRERLLSVPPETAGFLRWTTWSPDGGRIAYERAHYRSRLWLVDLYPDANHSSANPNEE